jgi:hypothetical protein
MRRSAVQLCRRIKRVRRCDSNGVNNQVAGPLSGLDARIQEPLMNNDRDLNLGQQAGGMMDGRDDPNRGPIDRAANALDGHDDPDRGPIDRTANALSGSDTSAAGGELGSGQGQVISALFDSDDEARQAVSELRSAGVDDASLSLITQRRGTTTTSNPDGDVVDEDHSSILRGILGGGVVGAGLGVAALAIPGVGPLVAAGAIAASAVPEAMAIGALAGATFGSIYEVLKKHGVSDEDAEYYGKRLDKKCVLVTVRPQAGSAGSERLQDILYRNGGHNAARARA